MPMIPFEPHFRQGCSAPVIRSELFVQRLAVLLSTSVQLFATILRMHIELPNVVQFVLRHLPHPEEEHVVLEVGQQMVQVLHVRIARLERHLGFVSWIAR